MMHCRSHSRRFQQMLTATLLLIYLAGCGRHSAIDSVTISAGTEARPPAPEVHELLDAWQAPAQFDADLAARLLRELSRVLAEQGITRMVSAPPTGPAGAVTDLTLNGDSFSWSLRNQGDYDQNGEVNVSDITPIGIYLGRTSADPDWFKAQLADGDGNGAITLADITPIGVNFGRLLDGYELQYSLDGQNSWARRSELPLAAAILPPGGGIKRFELLQPGAPVGFYRVVAYQHDPPSRELGASSNVVERQPSGGPVAPGNWNGSGADPENTGYSAVAGPASILGSQDLTFTRSFGQPLIGSDGKLYTAGQDGIISCFQAADNLYYGIDIGQWPLQQRLADDDSCYVSTLQGGLFSISPLGSVKWSLNYGTALKDIRVVPGGGVLVVDAADVMHRLNADGNDLWTYADTSRFFGQCMALPGSVFCVLSWTGQPLLGRAPAPSDVKISAFDDSGGFLWEYILSGIANQTRTNFFNSDYLARDSAGHLLVNAERLVAIDSSGALAWQGEPELIYGSVKSNSAGQICYTTFLSAPDHVRCLDSTGSELDSLECAPAAFSPALGPDGRFSWWSNDRVLRSMLPGDGGSYWEYTGLGVVQDGAGDSAGNYYGYYDGSVVSLDASGSFRWAAGGSGFPRGGFSFTDDGRVVSGYGGLTVIDVGDSFGTIYPCWNSNSGAPLIMPDDRIAFVGSFEGRPAIVCCADNGVVIWKHFLQGTLSTLLCLGGSGQLYYGWSEGATDHISCLDGQNVAQWTYALDGAYFADHAGPASMAVHTGADPELIYARASDRLLAVNGNGEFQWEYVFGEPGSLNSTSGVSVQPDGSAVFDDWDGNIVAIKSDGALKWAKPFGSFPYFGEQSVAPDGSVAFGSTDSHFYVINDDGSLRWSRPFASSVFSPVCRDNEPAWQSRPCIDGSCRLYIMQKDGTALILSE